MTEPTWEDYTAPRTIEVQGVSVAYRRKGSGEPLIFFHGAGLTRRWLPLYEELSKTFDVIAPEHLGFGDTPLPDWATGFDDLVIHYSAFLTELGIDKAHVAGHSFGAWIAAEFAAFYPERLLSLTLIAPGGLRPDADEPLPDLFRMDGSEAAAAILGADADRWESYLDEGDPAAQMITDYKESTALARFSWNPRYDIKLERRLGRVVAPAQVIIPQRDGLLPPSIARRYADALSGAPLVTLEGGAAPTEHLLIIQEPARLAGQIAAIAGSEA